MLAEQVLIGCALLDASTIDKAVQQGIESASFKSPEAAKAWSVALELRTAGQEVSFASVALKWGKECAYEWLGEAERAAPTQAGFSLAVEEVLWANRQQRIREKAVDLVNALADGASKDAVGQMATDIGALAEHKTTQARTLKDIADEAIKDAEAEIAGVKDTGVIVTTGLPTFDRKADAIRSHEYVLLGARTSHGKSSFLLQLAGHNLARGLRVAIFSLETSDTAVLRQIAGQRAKVNLRDLHRELKENQQDYLEELRQTRSSKNLLIFDKDLTLSAIQARCRLLATSFKPNLVILDYIGLIGVEGSGAYERMSLASKAMIPLRKTLGCALVVGAQLNRVSEKDKRPPGRTDFRDAGGLEEDAHRILALYRPDVGHNGQLQNLDEVTYDYEIFQLKCRDGAITGSRMKFHAPTTRFYEELQQNNQ